MTRDDQKKLNKRINKWANNCIRHHKERGFTIKINEAELRELALEGIGKPCYFCGNIIQDDKDKWHPTRFSLDIIDPHERIMEGWNVRIICRACNSAKGNLDDGEFLQRCKDILTRCEGVYV